MTPAAPAPTVVLVHGSLDRGASFARTVRRLGDLHVVTYDRRGYHHSRAMPLARSLDEHVADLVALVGDGPAVVVGHSYGGDVALGAALEAPDVIGAVGAYEPPLPWCDWWPRRSASSIADEDPATFAEGFFRRVVGDAGWDRLSDQARADRRADGPALVAELVRHPPTRLALRPGHVARAPGARTRRRTRCGTTAAPSTRSWSSSPTPRWSRSPARPTVRRSAIPTPLPVRPACGRSGLGHTARRRAEARRQA